MRKGSAGPRPEATWVGGGEAQAREPDVLDALDRGNTGATQATETDLSLGGGRVDSDPTPRARLDY